MNAQFQWKGGSIIASQQLLCYQCHRTLGPRPISPYFMGSALGANGENSLCLCCLLPPRSGVAQRPEPMPRPQGHLPIPRPAPSRPSLLARLPRSSLVLTRRFEDQSGEDLEPEARRSLRLRQPALRQSLPTGESAPPSCATVTRRHNAHSRREAKA